MAYSIPDQEILGTRIPDSLYKYRSLDNQEERDWVKQTILNDVVYFSTPDQFNDPFDCAPIYKVPPPSEFVETVRELWRDLQPGLNRHERRKEYRKIRKIPHARLAEGTKDVFESMRKTSVYSMTPDCSNLLMWSHYASSHRGLCLHFDTRLLFGGMLVENDISGGPVTYSNERPTVYVGEKYDPPREGIRRMFFVKALQWEYENEWRLFDLGSGAGLRPIQPESLISIIVGAHMSQDNLDFLKELLSRRRLPVKLQKAVLDNRDFRVVAVDLD